MRGVTGIVDALFLTRPVLWIPVWGFSVLGLHRRVTMARGGGITILWRATTRPVAAALFLFSAAVGAVYVLNQIADRDTDSRNEGFALLAHGNLSGFGARVAFCVCAAVAIAGPPALGFPGVAAASVAALAVGVVYSCRPLRLSGKPGADFLTNAAGYALIAFGVGWSLGGQGWGGVKPFVVAAAPYFFMMCGGSISSTIPDVPGDLATGKRTTAVVLGPDRAHLLATVFVAAGLAAAMAAGDLPALVGAAAALPLYVVYVFRKTTMLREATYKVGGGILMLCAAVLYPALAAAAVVVTVATVLYFRLRHGLTYPSLRPARKEDS